MRDMIPDISDNPTFQRYHQIWRTNPSSVIFAPLAEILNMHKCYQEAITVCKKGLERNPDLISGRIALARAYVGVANYERAIEEAKIVLLKYPEHADAREILNVGGGHVNEEEEITQVVRKNVKEGDSIQPSRLNPGEDNRWYTITMAEIYESQGDMDTAKKIYSNVLKKDPNNIRAKEGLDKISKHAD